jgi:peroxiredoxin family protein
MLRGYALGGTSTARTGKRGPNMALETLHLMDAPQAAGSTLTPAMEQLIRERVDQLVDERVREAMKADPSKNRVAIIASKGTLDMAYPPLILATAAAAMGQDVEIFFTFYGLDIIKKGGAEHLQVAPIANPAMPVPMPNILGMLPGMTPMATWMMKSRFFARNNVATIPELIQQCKDLGVKFIACQMTMDVMGIKSKDLIEGVEIGGAATFLDFAAEAHTTLFV